MDHNEFDSRDRLMHEADGEETAHPPRSNRPSEAVLGPLSRVRDAVTGETSSAEAWLAARATTQDRDLGEVSDELMNAIARGDLIVVDDGLERGREDLSEDAESGGP